MRKRLKYIMVKSAIATANSMMHKNEHQDEEWPEHEEHKHDASIGHIDNSAEGVYLIRTTEAFNNYLKKHGYHFTDMLAEYASKMMVNANGQMHTWNATQVKRTMDNLGLTTPDKVTTGDVTYLANMYYADLFPDPLKDEASCIRAAYKMANDPDGYEGMIFCRWATDATFKGINIEWDKFV